MRGLLDSTVSRQSSVVCRMAKPYCRDCIVISGVNNMDSTMHSITNVPDLREVLDRDQRTVLTTRSREEHRTSTPVSSSSSSTTSPYRIYYYRLPASTSKRILRFGEVLTLCTCILGVIRLPLTMSAPISSHTVDFSKPPEWMTPCHSDQDSRQPADDDLLQEHELEVPLNNETLNKIVLVAGNALAEVDDAHTNAGNENWKHKYARHYFGTDLQAYYDTWKDNFSPSFLPWLPSAKTTHKQMGQPVPEDYLRTLNRDTALKDSYEWLQKIAVAVEQVIADQRRSSEPFEELYSKIFWSIRAVLCEIETAMYHFQVNKHPDVQRDVMKRFEREYISEQDRNMRDIYVLINYINTMEYIRDAFEYLKKFEKNV